MSKRIVILALTFVLFPLIPLGAQEREADALCIWSTTALKKSFGKDNRWGAGVLQEYRHKIREGVSKTDQWFIRSSVSYNVLPWLKLQYQVDFASTSSGFNLRSIPEISFSHKTGNFSFFFRQRMMTTWKTVYGTTTTVLRSRAKVDYHIPDTPLSVIFAVEPYWGEFSKDYFTWFQKCRWYAGVDIKLTDNLTFSPHYNCQAYHNHRSIYDRRSYDDHVIYFTFTVKL